MKLRNPDSREDLHLKKKLFVLEVGGGHNPHPRANVVVDKFIASNYHRSGDIRVLKNQKFLQADGEKLPFKDNEFDYVICNHVLEHVEDPYAFLNEQFRVAKKGYIETPSLIGEFLIPKKSHKWLILEINNKLVLVEKEKINFNQSNDFGKLFQGYFPKNSIGFKILERTHPNILTIRYEWKDNIDYLINPDDPEILKYFKDQWNEDAFNNFMPKRSLFNELMAATSAFGMVIKSVIKSKLLKFI